MWNGFGSNSDYSRTLLWFDPLFRPLLSVQYLFVDHDLNHDVEVRFDRVLLELASATWRDINTRLLIEGSRTNPEVRGTTLLAKTRAVTLVLTLGFQHSRNTTPIV